jgi:hypothetical protein
MSNKIAYWLFAALACACGFLPYYSTRLFGPGIDVVAIDFTCAALWVAFFSATVHFAKAIGWGRWWVALTGPFALFHVFELLLMVLFWKLGGFAP